MSLSAQPTMVENPAPAPRYGVVDLFCGIGGMSHGFLLEGFKVSAGVDLDESCRYAFESNNDSEFKPIDLSKAKGDEIAELFERDSPRVLVGCAPCQAFSPLANKDKDKKNEKWKLLGHFGRLISETRPDVISMENVPTLRSYAKGEVFEEFMDVLRRCGYRTPWVKAVETWRYGVPQRRKRLVLLASLHGPIEMIPPTHTDRNELVLEKIIGSLPPIGAGEKHPEDTLHRSAGLSEVNMIRMTHTPYGGSWRDWPEHLILECHKKESGKSFGSVYGRMKWEELASTMTTQCGGFGNGRFAHPEQNRAISLREAAMIQSFPRRYQFEKPDSPMSMDTLERHIGNAVPVNLGRAIAKTIKQHLNTYFNGNRPDDPASR